MTERLSKSEMKRRFKQEEEVALELALLSDKDLKLLEVSDELKKEIIQCRSVKDGARKRQVKYLAKLMREESVDDILVFLAARKGSKLKDNKLHHEAERLRDAIITEAIEQQQLFLQRQKPWEPDWKGEQIDDLIAKYPIDSGDLRRTVHQYVKTRFQNHYKEVFRIVKAALEKNQLLGDD
ncbi:MAG: ribosome-associated protein [Desulforhopalus sp.]|jgi:ribosome-associated protein